MIILGRTLRQLRYDADMTQKQACVQCRFSESKLSALELGQRVPSMFDVAGMCRVYGASRDLEEQLIRMADQADKPGWWEPYATSMLADFSVLLELEQVCSRMLVYQSELVPGLLQTRTYARTVYTSSPAFDDGQIEQAVELRSARQAHFWGRTPMPEVSMIVHESALIRPVCGPRGDAEQQDRISEAAQYADIRVLPTSVGAHASMLGSYLILDSTLDDISDVVYTETISGGRYEEDASILADYRRFWEHTRKTTIPFEEYRQR